MRTRTWTVAAIALACTFALGACSDDEDEEGSTEATIAEPEGEGDAEAEPGEGITIANFAFSPNTLTVASGGTVAVANEDGTTHTFSSEDGGFDVELAAGDSSDVQIDAEVGEYDFRCDIHPSMTGTLTVE